MAARPPAEGGGGGGWDARRSVVSGAEAEVEAAGTAASAAAHSASYLRLPKDGMGGSSAYKLS